MNKILGTIVGLVVVIAAVVGIVAVKSHNVVAPTGGNVLNSPDGFINGAEFGTLPVTVNYAGGKISAKTNVAFWKNTTATTQYVDYAAVATDGTASSTFRIYAYATSTAPRTLYDFVAPAQANANSTQLLINNFLFATTSAATTTTNFDKALAGKTVAVPVGSYVIIQMLNQDTGCASQGSGVCETATSSRRGFNLQWRLRFHN